jgi:hypothetical protein
VPNVTPGSYMAEILDARGIATGERVPVTITEGRITTLHIE